MRRIYWIVFGVVVVISMCLTNWQKSPEYYPDSGSYINVSNQIISHKKPDLSERTPTFPVYLSLYSVLFGNLKYFTFVNILFGGIAAVGGLWLLNKLGGNIYLNSIISIIAFTDYGVVNFYNTVLTESIGPVLIVLMLIGNLKNKWGVILVEILLIYLKPTFVFLPLSIKIYIFINKYIFRKLEKTYTTKFLLFGIIVNLICVSGLVYYNYSNTGKLLISKIGIINSFGVALTSGYLEKLPYYKDAPSVVLRLIDLNLKYNRLNSPYEMIEIISKEKIPGNYLDMFEETNKYLFYKNKRIFVLTRPKLIIDNFSVGRQFYSDMKYSLSSNDLYMYLNKLYSNINSSKFMGIVIGLGIYIFLFTKKSEKAIYLGALLLIPIFVVVLSSVFSYSEFYRLKQPVDPLLNIIALLPIIYINPLKNNK